ncbi:nitroreductase [Bacillus carboniphilus]|uniref:Putative NAD(P)H nitroreductase n=1 Tax=Bacillus carboniphilus TaxID=86663 RepID=A0ABY9JR15_9BACI|nr:nitroreductase [Bacillus carboniphilus]WLR41772.1 nitroreductase [Bacillus carboniphilus]
MTQLANIIKERRTVRDFTSQPIDMDSLINLLDQAAWAPNHGHREPWQFKLFVEGAKQTLLNEIVKSYQRIGITKEYTEEQLIKYKKVMDDFFLNTPAHLLIYMKKQDTQKVWEEDFLATAAFIQNFQLLAWEQGLGMVWKTNPYIYDPEFCDSIGLAEDEKIVGVLHIGYPKKVPKAKERTPIREKMEVVGG